MWIQAVDKHSHRDICPTGIVTKAITSRSYEVSIPEGVFADLITDICSLASRRERYQSQQLLAYVTPEADSQGVEESQGFNQHEKRSRCKAVQGWTSFKETNISQELYNSL